MSDIPKQRRSKSEVQLIINEVVTGILQGNSYSDLLMFMKNKYGIKRCTAQWYYEKADKKILEICEKDRANIFEKQMSRYNQRLYRCEKIENPKEKILTELKVLERIDKISGLEKTNINSVITIKDELKNMDDKTIDQEIKKLDGK